MLKKFVAGLAALVLGGCLEYNDSIRMEPSGKGTFRMEVAVPAGSEMQLPDDSASDVFGTDSLKARFARIRGVHADSLYDTVVGEKRLLVAVLRYDSLAALVEVGGNVSSENFVGNLAVSKDENGLHYYRRLDPYKENSGPEDGFDAIAQAIMHSMMGTLFWSYTVQYPGKVLEANTASNLIDSAAGKVTWRFPATDVMNTPLEMKARFALPVPKESEISWVLYGVVTATVVLLLAFIAILLRWRAGRR